IAIDDEPLALRQIKSYIDKAEQLELVAACRSAEEASRVIAETKVDLIFVDINMPDMNGLDFVRSLTTAHHIVFTTAHPEFAIDGFKLNALDYLLKPFTFEEFMKATNKVISLVDLVNRCHAAESAVAQNEAKTTDKEVLSVKADYKTQLVKIVDIVYLESAGEYVRLHIEGSSTITTLFRLKNMEASLPAENFMRVHRSYIVNLKRIASYTKGRIFLDNGEYIPLGENYKERFLEWFDK
ncbi:MAG: response regulator transcription factor, partial [Alistipes sp.]|nr:response regulator transcription factor [Alistipes sp.]